MQRRDLLKILTVLGSSAAIPAAEILSGRARFRSALCAYSFRTALGNGSMRYENLVRFAVEHGLDGLDLTVYWFPNTEDSFLLPLKRIAYRSGVEIYSISVRTDMCQPTAAQREAQFVEVKKWVDVAARLGAGHIRVFGGNVPKGSTEQDAIGWVVETLRRGGEYAGSSGVILGLENHGGITEKAETILSIVKKVDSPWVGVNLDTGNFRTRIDAQIELLAPYAVNIQIKADVREDGVSKPADWDRTFRMLAKAGYKGYVALEYEAEEDPATAVSRLSRKLAQMAMKYSVS